MTTDASLGIRPPSSDWLISRSFIANGCVFIIRVKQRDIFKRSVLLSLLKDWDYDEIRFVPRDRCIALSNTKTNKTNDTKTSLILVKTTLHRREKETNILNSLSRERKNSKSHHTRVPLKPSTDLSRSLSFGTSSTPSSLTLPPRTLLSRSTFVSFFFMAMIWERSSLSRASECLKFQILSYRRDEFSTKISLSSF